jgi:DNA-binding transcriptional LysR family regulator
MTTLRALECLVALEKHGSMSAAADALYMSQPALSHQIAALEKELGVPVAVRLSRGVRLTVAGRAAAEEARVALRAVERAVQIGKRVGDGSNGVAGRLRVSCVETMTAWLLVPVFRHWQACRRGVALDLAEFTSPDQMADVLAAGGTDVAVGPRPNRTQAHIDVIGQQEMVVVAAAGHRFADMPAVPMEAMAGEPFVHYDSANAMALWLDQYAAQNAVILNPVLRTRSSRTAALLAAAGMGVTIVPMSALVGRPALVVRRLRPIVKGDVVAMSATPSDTLVRSFIADLCRRGLPNSTWPG